MSEFPVESQTMSGIGSDMTATADGALANGLSSSGSSTTTASGRSSAASQQPPQGDVAAMIENFQHKKSGASSHSTASMLNRINHHQSSNITVPGTGATASMVVTSGSPGTTLIIGNTNPTQQQVVSSTSSSTSSSRVKRSSQVSVATCFRLSDCTQNVQFRSLLLAKNIVIQPAGLVFFRYIYKSFFFHLVFFFLFLLARVVFCVKKGIMNMPIAPWCDQ